MKNLYEGLDLPEEVQKTLTERINTEIEAQKTGVKNDPEFIRGLKSEVAGEFFKKQEKTYKKVFPGLNLDEIEGSGPERMEAIAKAGVALMEKSKDATNQDLQKQLMDLQSEYTTYKEDIVPQLLQDQKQGYHRRYIDSAILQDSLEFDTVIKAEVRPAIVDTYLHRKGWQKRWNEDTDTYSIVTSDNLIPTQDNKPLSNADVIRMALDDAGVLQKSNGSGSQAQTTGNTGQQRKKTGELTGNAAAMKAQLTGAS